MENVKIGKMTLGSCATNCYFLYTEEKKECIVVDPADQGERIYDALTAKGFTIVAIILTHGHFDHIWGVASMKEKSGVKVYAAEPEVELLGNPRMNISSQAGRACTVQPDEVFTDGQMVTIADMQFKVIFTPGHTKGSCCFYFEKEGFLVSGDTLFEESVGRTDFPTGSMSEIVRSITEKLYVLPEETKVYPGHGESTTIAHEKQYNPYTVL